MIRIYPLMLILFAVVFEVFADILFKKWAIDKKDLFLYAGLAMYFVGTVFWAVSLKYEYLSKAVSAFTILNLIVLVVVGSVLFKEDLSIVNKIGVGLGIISIILIEM